MRLKFLMLVAASSLFFLGCDDEEEGSQDGGSTGGNSQEVEDPQTVCTDLCIEQADKCPDDGEDAESCKADCEAIFTVVEMTHCEAKSEELFDCIAVEEIACGEGSGPCDAQINALDTCIDEYEPEDDLGNDPPSTKCREICEARLEKCPDSAEEGETCDSECGPVESYAKIANCEAEATELFDCAAALTDEIECGQTTDACDTEQASFEACLDAYEP